MDDKQETIKKERYEWLESRQDTSGWVVFCRDGMGPLICKHNGNKHPLFFWFEDREEADSYWKSLLDDTRALSQVMPCTLREVLIHLPLIYAKFPDLCFSALFKQEVPTKLREKTTVFDYDDGTVHPRAKGRISMI